MERALLKALREANDRALAIEEQRHVWRADAIEALRVGEYDRYSMIMAELDYASAMWSAAHRSWWETHEELQRLLTTPIVADEVLQEESTEPLPPAGGAGDSAGAPGAGEGTARPLPFPEWQGYFGDT